MSVLIKNFTAVSASDLMLEILLHPRRGGVELVRASFHKYAYFRL